MGQRKGGDDIHGRLQHGPWPAGHADRASGQDRRRLAGEALAGAYSSRHVNELLGNHDDAPAAHGLDNVLNPSREGQAWILLRDMACIHASEGTLAAMRAAVPHVVLCFIPPRSTSCSPATWPSSAASRTAFRWKRAPLLPTPSSTARSKAWP